MHRIAEWHHRKRSYGARFVVERLGGGEVGLDENAAHRKILLPHLSAKRVRVIEQFAEQTTQRLWSEALAEGRIEWMSAIANRLPMMVVAQLLGLPHDDVDKLIRLGYATTTVLDGIVTQTQLEAAGIAAMELGAYVLEHFENAPTGPQSGLMADLAARCASGELEQTVALAMMLTLFSAAGESTASLLGSAAWILVSQPDIQKQVRENPDLLSSFIEETLRFEPPFRAHYRHVLRDTTLDSVEVPADSHLLLMWGAANRDPAQFDSPQTFGSTELASRITSPSVEAPTSASAQRWPD